MTMVQSARPLSRLASLLILVAALPVIAQSRGGQRPRSGPGTGSPEEQPPPWRFIEQSAAPVTPVPTATTATTTTTATAPVTAPPANTLALTTPLTLYWLPASNAEMDRSPLLSSRPLYDASVRCVALEAIVPDNAAIVEKLGAAGKLPTAVLIDSHGAVIRRVENVSGVLRPSAVEQMVSEELNARDEAMFLNITAAKQQADAGDKQKAIDLYRKVWDDRCLFPTAGQEAQSALKALGVVVKETPVPSPVDPNLRPTPTGSPHP